MKYQALVTIVRDVASMALGAWIVINEELSGQTHPDLLYLAGLFVGGPTIIAGLSLLIGRSAPPDTHGESSPSGSEHSP